MMNIVKRILFEIFRFPLVSLWKLAGWRITRDEIEDDKVVLTGAPHTSNWDYFHFLMSALTLRRKIYVTVKKELFFPPLGWLLKALGGIPVDRHNSQNLVGQLAEKIKNSERMVLLFTPDGSRSYRPYWKSGFYWTAVEAGVPIILGIPDFRTKVINLDTKFMPSGDIETDFAMIREQQEKHGYGLYNKKANPVITREAYEAQIIDEETDISAAKITQETPELSA